METLAGETNNPAPLKSFDCSYKGWKLRKGVFGFKKTKRFDCSYKGWKQPKHFWNFHIDIEVLIVPIRDGNSLPSLLPSSHPQSFDCSYKGWKFKIVSILKEKIKGFDCSYKGWKHLRCCVEGCFPNPF